jgi:hypothetical protein
MNTISINRSQLIVVQERGQAFETNWTLVTPECHSPGLVRSRYRETDNKAILEAMTSTHALARVRVYTPRGGWPAWGLEYLGQVINLPVGEILPLSVDRFKELTGWSPE